MPRHRRPPRHLVSRGSWLRWTINYRLGLDHGWSYGLVTWNVAFQVEPLDRALFLNEPSNSVDELSALR